MDLEDLRKHPSVGRRKERRRVGRGQGTGRGKLCGRGMNGAKSRSGWKAKLGREGGQMPLFRRLPKRGFNNRRFETKRSIINVSKLNRFDDGAEVTPDLLREHGLIPKHPEDVKVLGTGELERSLTVRAHAFSSSARRKIEDAGGRATLIENE